MRIREAQDVLHGVVTAFELEARVREEGGGFYVRGKEGCERWGIIVLLPLSRYFGAPCHCHVRASERVLWLCKPVYCSVLCFERGEMKNWRPPSNDTFVYRFCSVWFFFAIMII